MEIYRQRENRVYFQLPGGAAFSEVTASLNDGEPVNIFPEDPNAAVLSALLPFIPHEGTVRVNWEFMVDTFSGFDTVTVTRTYDVVTPILSRTEIRKIHPSATDDEVTHVEKAVRHIINAHTGQSFGLYEGEHVISGDDSKALLMPERLIELYTVDGVSGHPRFAIDADGYILRHFPWGVPPIKADYNGLHQTGGTIYNPNNVNLGSFNKAHRYRVDGKWGWEEVPSQVKEAAKLLVNDYACAEQSYRDRFLTSMTAADWRIQYHSGAFTNTGNVRADQLLSAYVIHRGWMVI